MKKIVIEVRDLPRKETEERPEKKVGGRKYTLDISLGDDTNRFVSSLFFRFLVERITIKLAE